MALHHVVTTGYPAQACRYIAKSCAVSWVYAECAQYRTGFLSLESSATCHKPLIPLFPSTSGGVFNVMLISFSSHIITFSLVNTDTHPWSAACPTESNGVFTFILLANRARGGRFKLRLTVALPIIIPPVHERTLIPFRVAVSLSNGKSNGTIVVVAPVSTQMSVSLSSSNGAKQFEVVGWGVINRCSTRLILMHFLPEVADEILNEFVLVVTVAGFILLLLSTVLQYFHSSLQCRQPVPV